ncbi:MAG: phosphatase PAP2 family protein [Pseudomonadota bacterium]
MRTGPLYAWLAVALSSALLFSLWPGLDLAVSSLAYEPGAGFVGNRHAWVRLVYDSARWLTLAALLLGLMLLGGNFVVRLIESPGEDRGSSGSEPGGVRPRMVGIFRPWPRRGAGAYLLLSLLLGPGLMVNEVLKEHWGRARPHQVSEFGGQSVFTPALRPAGNCDTNCSFVSGHSAIGFWWLALGLVWPTWRWRAMALGLVLGGALGLARIMQGGHFVSDVVFSFLVVWGMAELLAWVFRRQGWLPQRV